MRTQKSLIEDFCEFSDSKVTFSLYDSTYFEGYIFILGNDTFSFLISGPLSPDDPIVISYDAVDLKTLCYYDDLENNWKSVSWSNEANTWEIKDWIRDNA